jgi:mannose-6-phosphate isomerase-like protein (cupin superfamily)
LDPESGEPEAESSTLEPECFGFDSPSSSSPEVLRAVPDSVGLVAAPLDLVPESLGLVAPLDLSPESSGLVAAPLDLAVESLAFVSESFDLVPAPVGLVVALLDSDPEDFEDSPEPEPELDPFGLASSSPSPEPLVDLVDDDGVVAFGVDSEVLEAGAVATGVVAFAPDSLELEPERSVSDASELVAEPEPLAAEPLDDVAPSESSSTGLAGGGALAGVVDVTVVVGVVDEPSSSDSWADAGAAISAVTIAMASRPTGVLRERSMRSGRHISPRAHPFREISHPCQVSVTAAGFRRSARYAPISPAWQSLATSCPAPRRSPTLMSGFSLVNLREVEDMAPKFGFAPNLQARYARIPLGLQNSGLSLFRLAPNYRVPFGHRHGEQEEIYVVVSGTARVRVEDEVVELGPWDAIRLPPGTTRGMEAADDGAEILAFGAPNTDNRDAEMVNDFWPQT